MRETEALERACEQCRFNRRLTESGLFHRFVQCREQEELTEESVLKIRYGPGMTAQRSHPSCGLIRRGRANAAIFEINCGQDAILENAAILQFFKV